MKSLWAIRLDLSRSGMIKRISIIIPAFNESAHIVKTLHDIHSFCNTLPYLWEYIVVDDHSQDELHLSIESFTAAPVRVIRLTRRMGSHVAIRAGIHFSSGDAILYLAADGQDDPFVLKEMTQR